MTIQKAHNCKEELQASDLRATPARIAIMQYLETAKDPVDIAGILSYLQTQRIATDPATVFRIMHTFTQKDLALPIQLGEGKMRYEAAKKVHHHHLICERCGIIEDIGDTFIPATIVKEMGKKHHFLIKRHALEFFGLCKNCQK